MKRFNVLFIGTEQSGKTMLVSSVFEGKFESPPPQQKNKVKKYIARNVEFYVYDMPGGKEDLGKWDFFYKKCDVVVFVFDSCSSEQVCEEAKVVLLSLLYRNMWEKRNLLVLGSKNDIPNSMDCKDIILALGLVKIYDREIRQHRMDRSKAGAFIAACDRGMDARIKLEVNDAEVLAAVTHESIEAEGIDIKYRNIKSLHTKNDGVYLLTIAELSVHTLKFKSVHMRDLIKNIILKRKSADMGELAVFVQFPILIRVFEELDVSQTQFLNYYRSSFFHSIKNEKNSIDRLLGKNVGFPCDNFASRINIASILSIQGQKGVDVKSKPFSEKVVDFEPIYLKTMSVERKKINDFDFRDFSREISFDVPLRVEGPRHRPEFDRGDLEMLRKIRRSGKGDAELVGAIKSKYREDELALLKRVMPE
ncbi:UNVERIFIED_CONTAM: hypothetical protein PYX00_011755 [Menopon gallinae]|uniref:GTP-binding protein n=1 Tax=Menopon gallinae TaxID=328185 RepID=A0AAW2H8L8_9NEOP